MSFNSKEYQKKYYAENRERILKRNKEYRKKNSEAIRAAKRRYSQNNPAYRKRKAERSAQLYLESRDKVLARQSARRKERLGFINGIALRYGCQNPECKWQGEFVSNQLDFHHFDPTTKVTEVAHMESWSFERIVEEINKCVVLCKNCHALVHAGKITVSESTKCNVEAKNE